MGLLSTFRNALQVRQGSKTGNDGVGMRQFSTQRLVGLGGFGKVHAAVKKNGTEKGKIFAIKELSISKLVEKRNGIELLLRERNMLAMLKHPFICNLYYSFFDSTSCYLVMDIALGGDLRFYLKSAAPNATHKNDYNPARPAMPESHLKFFMRCIGVALKYVHEQDIIHRDIKPDNMLMEESGYVLLNDFGLAVKLKNKGCKSRSGTRSYMAPEVGVKDQTQNYAADIYSLGVTMYEMIVGKVPFTKEERSKLFHLTAEQQESLLQSRMVAVEKLNMSKSFRDLLTRMLCINQVERIGYERGAAEILEHKWLRMDDWDELLEKHVNPPFKPDTKVANIDERVVYEDIFAAFNPSVARKLTLPDSIMERLQEYPYDYTLEASKEKDQYGSEVTVDLDDEISDS
mmetsp:Transcript_9789/g.11283  ORF Transcript_9789/g.11283 Transcript_9789/m.11283 type:complete len:402 (-) Transcript_9789:1206-2411(-)